MGFNIVVLNSDGKIAKHKMGLVCFLRKVHILHNCLFCTLLKDHPTPKINNYFTIIINRIESNEDNDTIEIRL